MAPSGHYVVFSCFSFRGNTCYKSLNGAMFGPFRPLYYFSRLEICFALLFGDDWFAREVSFELRKSFFSAVLSTESINMDQKRLLVETGNTPNKPLRKRPTPSGSSRKSLFDSSPSGKPVS